MPTILIFLNWYYKDVPQKAFEIWKNYFWFWSYYFSLKDTLRTFFSPWKKYSEPYGRGLDVGRWVSTLVFNIFSRLMGMILRIFIILFTLLFEVLTLVIGVVFFVLWPAFPLFLISVLALGINLI